MEKNCNCPNRNIHPGIVTLYCPPCRLETMDCGSLTACGDCIECGTYTPTLSHKYCIACSNMLNRCEICGELIKSGNEYLPLIKEAL